MPDYSAGEAKLAIVPDVSGFQRKLEADLKKIDAELAIRVSADTAQARADITRFRDVAQRDDIKIGVTAATGEASADLAAWRARQEANRVKVKVDADTGGALQRIQALDGAFGDIASTLGKGFKFSLTWAGIGELPAVTLALTQAVGAVQQLAQAGLVLPGVFAGAAASIGTLALGLSGVSDAYEAVAKAAKPSLSDQAQHAREVTTATNAYRNAVVDEAQAERDRTRAVKDARYALEDLNLQLRGGKISEQQAINNALRQRRDLQRDLATGQIKDQLDLQQRLLDVESADQSVAEAHQRNIELQDKATEANEKGIANSDQVVAANERVTRSQQAVAQASDALNTAVGKPMAAVADAMANLSPNAQAFIKTLAGMQDEFNDLQNTVQDNLFAGMSTNIKSLVDADLPILKKGLGGIATAWNGTLTQLMKSLGTDSSKGLLERILGDTAKAQENFTAAIEPLVHGIETLTAAGADALPRLADDLKSVADRFNGFITAAAQDGRLDKWINDGITGFEHIGNTLLNVGNAITAVTQAAGGGEGLLAMLERGSKALADFLNSTEGQNQLKTWFEEGRREIQEHIIPLLKALPGIFKGVVDVGQQIADVVVPPLKLISTTLSEHPDLIHNIVVAFAAWKGIAGVSSLLSDLGKINDLLGAKGGKGGKGGKGILGKLALVTIAGVALDSLLDDPTQPPSASPGATPAVPQGQLPQGQLPAGQPVPFGSVPVVPPQAAKDAATGAVTGAVVTGSPWGAAVGPLLTAPPASDATKDDKRSDDEKTVDQIIYTLPQLPDNEVRSLADDLGISTDQLKSMSRDELRKRLLDAIARDRANPAPPAPPVRTAPASPVPAPPPAGSAAPDDLHGLLGGYSAGGPTPTWAGPLADGGYPAVVHPEEFVISKRGRSRVPDSFLHALNKGLIDPKDLPHFDVGGPGDGNIDPYGNPIQPGILPGPSQPVDPSAPIAPNPTGGGVGGIFGAVLSGLNNGPLSTLTSLIPGASGQQQTGLQGVVRPGLAGLFDAGGDQNKLDAWGQQTGNYLAGWGANFLTKFVSTLYSGDGNGGGLLGFLGLSNSILSPSNPWFQAGAKSLGILPYLFPQQGADGSLQVGSQSYRLGDGSTIDVPTFGTSFTPTGLTVGGANVSAAGGLLNPSSRASSLGGASVSYTPDMLLANGIAPLYTRTTDKNGNSVAQIPTWATQLAAAFNLTATSHSDSTLHGGQAGRGDSTNTNAGWAFDFSGKPEDEQRFADFIQGNLAGQTLQAIWQNPTTGQQLGIAGGQVLGRDQYYTTAGGNYAAHTDHVHWATDVAPVLWDPTTGKSRVPGIPDMAPTGGGPGWFAGQLKVGSGGVGGGLPGVPQNPLAGLPAGGGGQGALLNLALAGQRAKAATPAGLSGNEATVYQAMLAAGFGPSEWPALKNLLTGESGFRNTAKNPSSTAFGMFQFLDSTWATVGGSKTADPVLQSQYGLQYIKQRYGTPSAAWQFWQNQSPHWYDNGGWLPTGLSLVRNDTKKPEAVLTHEQGQAVQAIAKQAATAPPRPRPDFSPGDSIGHLNPGRGAAVVPSAPTKPLPVAPDPAQATPPADQQPPAQNQPRQPYQGPAPVAPAPGDLNHNLAAINTGISSGFATAGNLAATAISSAAAAGTFGAAGAAGAGGAGSLVAGLFNEGGKIATDLVNVGSSFLVGNVTAGTTPNAYGELNLAAQNAPLTAPDNRRSYVFNGVDGRTIVDNIRLKDAQDMQAQLANFK
ncbi:aggregation-promoting factor C-terminal-like domain-containing protein [Mycolicibacterium brisbanense]